MKHSLPDGTDAGVALHLGHKGTSGSNTVFARPYTIESRGHFVDVWSDADRVTWSECSCGTNHGPFHSAEGWQAVWSAHVAETTS